MTNKVALNQTELDISYQLEHQQSSVRSIDSRALMFKNVLEVNQKEKDYYYEKFRERLREYGKKDPEDKLTANWKIVECCIELGDIDEEKKFIMKVLSDF